MYTLGIPFIFLKQNNKNKCYSFISSFHFIYFFYFYFFQIIQNQYVYFMVVNEVQIGL